MVRGAGEGDLNPFQSRGPQEKKRTFDRRTTKTGKETDKGEEEFVLGRENNVEATLPLSVCSFLVYQFV